MSKVGISSKRFFASLVFIVVALLVLAACGAPGATTGPSSTTTAPSTGPKYGGTLRLSSGATPNTLDPILGYEPVSTSWSKLYSATPIKTTGKTDSELQLAPWLAKSWELSPDGLVLTMKLVEGVKFQNIPPVNGREVTADDFKYVIDRVMDPKTRSPAGPTTRDAIDRVEAVDKYTLKYFLKQPDSALLYSFTSGGSGVFAKEVIDKDGSWAKTIVGVGPFIFKEYVAGSRAIFEKNPNYFEKGLPYVDRVEVYIIPDEAARLAAFRAGELHSFLAQKSSADAVQKTVPGAVIRPGADPRGRALYMSIPQNPKTFGDARVRKAVALAIDYDGLIAVAHEASAYRTDFLGPRFKDWGARVGDQLPKRDIAKAKALLAEAGYPNGFKTSVIVDSTGDTGITEAEGIVAMLKDAGIECEIKPLDKASFQSVNKTGEFEMCLAAAQIEKADAGMSLKPLYFSTGAQNYSKYNNPEVDRLIELHRGTLKLEDRQKIVRQIMTILQNDQPLVPLSVRYLYTVRQPFLKGWENLADAYGQFGFHDILTAWLDK